MTSDTHAAGPVNQGEWLQTYAWRPLRRTAPIRSSRQSRILATARRCTFIRMPPAPAATELPAMMVPIAMWLSRPPSLASTARAAVGHYLPKRFEPEEAEIPPP